MPPAFVTRTVRVGGSEVISFSEFALFFNAQPAMWRDLSPGLFSFPELNSTDCDDNDK